MRLWSLHPKYLDPKGLVALWREALLAKNVLKGMTKGYKNHPQLNRFESLPLSFINTYLSSIYKESCSRGYCFDKRKIKKPFTKKKIPVTDKQIEYEFQHLKKKLKLRDKERYNKLLKVKDIFPHPLFKVRKGPVESWEKI